MPGPMHVEQAMHDDAVRVMETISHCIRHMQENGVFQWDALYPDLQVIREDIHIGSLFVIRQDGFCVASVTLNDSQPEEYGSVKWNCAGGRALVVHRLCVHPHWQGRGLARHLMHFTEIFATDRGFSCIRLDAYTGNRHAVALYERLGYCTAGELFFPRRELTFACFEKALLASSSPP